MSGLPQPEGPTPDPKDTDSPQHAASPPSGDHDAPSRMQPPEQDTGGSITFDSALPPDMKERLRGKYGIGSEDLALLTEITTRGALPPERADEFPALKQKLDAVESDRDLHKALSEAEDQVLAATHGTADTSGSNGESQPQPLPDLTFDVLPPEDQEYFREKGITEATINRMKDLMLSEGEFTDEQREEFFRLNEQIGGLSDEYKQKLSDIIASARDREPETPPPPPSPETAQLMSEAEEAMKAVMDMDSETFDIDKARAAARQYEKARQEADKEAAAELGKGPGGWYWVFTVLGVAFFLCVGAQAAMAAAVENAAGNGK